MSPLQSAIIDYQEAYNTEKLLSGKRLTELPSKQYVTDISKALDNMFKFYYLSGRVKVNDFLKKEIAKYDKKEAEKIKFTENDGFEITQDKPEDVIGKQFRPSEAIKDLTKQLQEKKGNIYKTRLDTKLLIEKVKKIAILSYSDYVSRVNTKLLVALEDYEGTPYKKFIELLKADQVKGISLKDAVDVKGYWQTVFRTNSATIFNAGYIDQKQEVKEYIAYEEYNAVIQDHDQCKALAGVIKREGYFESNGLMPPVSYNCTGYINPISKVRAEALNIRSSKKNISNIKADSGFGRITKNKASSLPKKTEKRLPEEWRTRM